MKEKNLILEKTFGFSIMIYKLYKELVIKEKEYIIAKQVLKSGTSIGANVNEAQAAMSKKDFIAKLEIASKEARETQYWIDLLIAVQIVNKENKVIKIIHNEIIAINKILSKIIITTKNKIQDSRFKIKNKS
ncbi:MAG: four helix bundle protein [Pseudomonadota bacterium]